MAHYEVSHNPTLFQYTRRAAYEGQGKTGGSQLADAGEKSLALSAAHWGSTYKNNVDESMQQPFSKSTRPVWSLPRQAYSSKRSHFTTEAQVSLGTYGYNPRNKLGQDSEKMENERHELTMGTTKTTTHIPGYNGFIPQTDFNQLALDQAALQGNRNTIVKQNIVENYQIKLPGYSGHKPMSSINDKGVVRPNCLGTAGEKFH